uniref:LPXTG cell wall anchor domain-containing protein n=1 Tax=Streptomyces albidus (ex Kaewkla and Franco 2022) TaxID=722709 RepID=UPI0015EF1EEE
GDDTCDLNDDSVDCEGGNTDPDSAGSQPVEQQPQAPKEELADTGSAETTFLLVGAATMIAGGVGFRMMPRMINRRTAA